MRQTMSLNDTLKALGYTTQVSDPGSTRQGRPESRRIIDAQGNVAFRGRAWEVWDWLRDTDQINKSFEVNELGGKK